jgi:hypothetical protein
MSPLRDAVAQRSRFATGSSLAVQTGPLSADTVTIDPVEAAEPSVRTKRRVMLTTELSASLRSSLLWHRRQKNNQAEASKMRKCQSKAHLSNLKSNLTERVPEPFLSSGYEKPKLVDGEVPENVFDKGASLYFNHGW